MPVDNQLYDRLSHTWWDENEALGLLRTWLNPVRFGYFQRVLLAGEASGVRGQTLLDVGCGGGLLAEEFARAGCRVTGIDPSAASLEVARGHARQAGLAIDYQIGAGEHLPFAAASFDLVVCCDVLEHVDDVERVIAEIARTLKPGGIFFYDTINRSWLSWIGAIKLAQEWTHFLPPNLHDWQMFIRPAELRRYLERSRLTPQESRGMSPRANPLLVLYLLLQQRRKKITVPQVGERIQFHESKSLAGAYMGYAVKPVEPV